MKTLIVAMIALFMVPMTQASVATSFGMSEKDAAELRGAFEYIIDNAENASEEGKVVRSRMIIELNKKFNEAVKKASPTEQKLIAKYSLKGSLQQAFQNNLRNTKASRAALEETAKTFLAIVK